MKTKVFFFSLLMGLVMVGNVRSAYAEDFEIPENQTIASAHSEIIVF